MQNTRAKNKRSRVMVASCFAGQSLFDSLLRSYPALHSRSVGTPSYSKFPLVSRDDLVTKRGDSECILSSCVAF